jgi:hypothetical protein
MLELELGSLNVKKLEFLLGLKTSELELGSLKEKKLEFELGSWKEKKME